MMKNYKTKFNFSKYTYSKQLATLQTKMLAHKEKWNVK